jgi:hypothetical protein
LKGLKIGGRRRLFYYGSGFWDGGWIQGDELTKMAYAYGTADYILDEDELSVVCM